MSDLTETEVEVLTALEWANHGSRVPQEWCRPLDVGGSNGSHHSATLNKLAARGLVQFRQRTWRPPHGWENESRKGRGRGSKSYRITPAGREAIAAHKATEE